MDDNANYLKAVRNQYEDYPYPPREPEDERHRLLRTGLCELPQLNHWCHAGRQGFEGYHALVAGGGTGDATVFLAEQLRERGGRVVHLDLSTASMEVAKQRCAVRGLTNVEWVHGSLLDLPKMGLGPFDHINCSGVLHHLSDPDQGLAALRAVLRDDGSMGIMLYGQYAREGVYQMQALLRLLNQGETDMDACVRTARVTLGAVPASNWYKFGEKLISDVWKFGDPGIYDLLLHSQDRAYTVPQLYDYVEKLGMRLVAFGRPLDRMLLTPEFSIREPRLLQRLNNLQERDRQAAMEIFTGTAIKHSFYVSPRADSVASLDDLDNVPFLYGFAGDDPNRVIADFFQKARGKGVTLKDQDFSYPVQPRAHSHHILRHMDGTRTTAEIFEAVRAATGDPRLTDPVLLKDFRPVYEQFNQVDHMLLRHKTARPLPPLRQQIAGDGGEGE